MGEEIEALNGEEARVEENISRLTEMLPKHESELQTEETNRKTARKQLDNVRDKIRQLEREKEEEPEPMDVLVFVIILSTRNQS